MAPVPNKRQYNHTALLLQPTNNQVLMSDELAEIDGHKPKVYFADGEEREVKSMTRCVIVLLPTLSLTCV